MSVQNIITQIDAEIAKLQQARQLLSIDATVKRGPGRPRKNAAQPAEQGKRALSTEARARIAAAQKARWAKAKKAAK